MNPTADPLSNLQGDDDATAAAAVNDGGYHAGAPGGIRVPTRPIAHRDEEYDEGGFDILAEMQRRHFWYRGRHRFVLRAMLHQLGATTAAAMGRDRKVKAIDLGGGCGGWIAYLREHAAGAFDELALADSSIRALEMAAPIVGAGVPRYQIDLMDLVWKDRWDVAFMLDVLEHIPDDAGALRQVWQALRPGGLLLVTTPALRFFWSYNDDMAHHVRRYSRGDFARLARETGFELSLSRYFMFFLSPLLLASRLKKVDTASMTREQINEYQARTHRVPAPFVNAALAATFGAETPLGLWAPFPWGTSVLGVFRKPA